MESNVIRKEMTCSRQEFFRQFKIFAADRDYTQDTDQITVRESNRHVKFSIHENNDNQLGALFLPSLTVSMEFRDYSVLQQSEFLERFNKSFQRGGG